VIRKILKWIGIGLGSLIGLAAAALAVAYFSMESKLNKVYTIPSETVSVPASFPADTQGFPRAMISFCQQCHGGNLAGQVLSEDIIFGRFIAPNLTSGKGGIGGQYTDADFVRLLRHGVRPNGKPVIAMPAELFTHLSAGDLGDVIAYVKSVPPVDNELPRTFFGPIGRGMVLVGMVPMTVAIPAEGIDHAAPPPDIKPGVTAEYGKYMAIFCTGCHGEDFAGGESVSAGVNLTPGGDLATWTDADFVNTLRTGVTPGGKTLDPEKIPLDSIRQLTDDELKAIWLYLQTLPPVQNPTPTPAP
jgi:mono/diheme cytochrome c family protein